MRAVPLRALQSLAGPVDALRFLQLLNVGWRQLRAVDGKRDSIKLAGEIERRLVVGIVHPGEGVGTDIQCLVPLQDERNGMFHPLRGYGRAVLLEHAGASLAEATVVAEHQRARARALPAGPNDQKVAAPVPVLRLPIDAKALLHISKNAMT